MFSLSSQPFPLSSLSLPRLCECTFPCVVLCEGVHHSQSVKPDLWDAESWSVLFLCLYCIIPTGILWVGLLMPLGCTWSFLLSLCTGLLIFPERCGEGGVPRWHHLSVLLEIATRMFIFICLMFCHWCWSCTAPLPPHLPFGWMLVIITSEPARAEQERNASY